MSVRLIIDLSTPFTMAYTGQTPEQLHREFADIRYHFNSRYVRLYGACDRADF